jgi:hypothetical protein
MNEMTDKDRADCLIELAKIHRDQFSDRRKVEWKVIFGSLTFFALLCAAKYNKDVNLPPKCFSPFLVLPVLFLFWLLVLGFLADLHKRNNLNKTFAKNAEDGVDQLLRGSSLSIKTVFEPDKEWKVSREWAFVYQVVFFTVVAIVAGALLIN